MIIKPANRTNSVSEYYFSKKLQEIDLMNRQGAEVINLGIGAPDRMPPEEAILTLIKEAQHPGNHAYQSYKGIKELREEKAWTQTELAEILSGRFESGYGDSTFGRF